MFKGDRSEMPTGEFPHVSLTKTIEIRKPKEGELGLPQIPEKDDVQKPSDPDTTITTNFRRPAIATSELPPIPEEIIAGAVQKQAELVIRGLIGDGKSKPEGFIVEQDKEREVFVRRRIIIQLEKVMKFLSKLWKSHSNHVPSLADQFSIYQRTIIANIESLGNQDIETRNVITNMSRFVVPQLIELRRQFKSYEDENFSFDEVRDQIKECLGILANMEHDKS